MSSIFLKFFSGLGCSPVGGNFFGLPCWACVLRAGVLCFSRGRAAANSPPVPGEERRAVPWEGGPAFYLFSRSRSFSRNSSMVLHSSASIKSRSRSASCACCTSNSPVFGVVMFTSPFWSPWSAVRWAAVAVAVRLPCMIAADFCAVNRAVFVPQSPFRGGRGEVFLHKIPWRFLCKSLHLGDYRGHISLAYPGTIPGAVNTLGGGSGLPGGRSADRRGRRSRRQILHRRQAVRVGGSDGGSVSGRRSAGWRTAPAVGRTASHPPAPPTGRAQEIPNAQARAEIPCRAGPQAQHSASHPPPERPAIRQPNRPAGRRRYQTPAPAKIPRRAGPREILNAPARGTGGAAVVLCGFGSPKFF